MIGEKGLLFFSRKRDEPDYDKANEGFEIGDALKILTSSFGNGFLEEIEKKVILDHGCGSGFQLIALALSGAECLVGVDIREELFVRGLDLAEELKVDSKLSFLTALDGSFQEYFDIIISQNSFEHYADPYDVIKLWKNVLKPKGKIFLTFGPPWFAPYGSHTYFFTKFPWVNILFSEATVMQTRSHFRCDGAKHYEEVEGGLNKMSVKKFNKIVGESGLNIRYKNYRAVKGMKLLTKIPFACELFINHIDCIMIKE